MPESIEDPSNAVKGTASAGSTSDVAEAAKVQRELETLRAEVASLRKERQAWLEERKKLNEENESLRNRCQKLSSAASSLKVPEGENFASGTNSQSLAEARMGRNPPLIEQMLRNPKDEAVQLHGIEELFSQQTQVDGAAGSAARPLQGSLEASVAILSNHPGNRLLLLKASQFLSVLLAEPDAGHTLPLAALFQAAQQVVSIGAQLVAAAAAEDGIGRLTSATAKVGGVPDPAKLLTWMLSLLALLLPCLGQRLHDQHQSEGFIRDLLGKLVSPLLAAADMPPDALILKCAQLPPLLPAEPWVQKACFDTGAVHAFALAYHRGAGHGGVGGNSNASTEAIRAALRYTFAKNPELCVRAVHDTFASDEFVCLEVLEELRALERRQRGTFLALDSDHGLVGKVLGLWAFHQRRVLEDSEPEKSPSREVLRKVADLLSAVLLKLPPQVLLGRMQEFKDVEVLQRIALSAIHGSAQLRLQVAVNYVSNAVVPVVISCMQMFLVHDDDDTNSDEVEAAFRLLNNERLPAEGWPYMLYCLEVCLHVLRHWSATKPSLGTKADVLDTRAAPLLLAQGGLVDVLAELVDPAGAGVELRSKPPEDVVHKASETLQALFEQSGHICLFCMQHYVEVRQMASLGCDSLASDPLAEFPDMQQQAVTQLSASFERFAAQDERLGRKILKTLAVLFESSYRLVAWFLQQHSLSTLGDLDSLDVHVEAVRAVSRTPYWSSEDVPLLTEFVALIAKLLLGSTEAVDEPSVPGKRRLDLTEAEEVAAACMTSLLHLLLIDPSPPTVLHCLAQSLGQGPKATGDGEAAEEPAGGDRGSELAVGAVMRIMQVFPSSDRVQMNCQHLLTSLLGE